MLSNKNEYQMNLIKGLNTLLLIGFLVMSAVSVILVLAIYQLSGTQSRTLVPPLLTEPVKISNTQVDASYLKQMSEYFLSLKLNVTPKNVERNFSQLADYIDPRVYHDIRPKLVEEAKAIKSQHISASFFVKECQVAKNRLMVKFNGELRKYVGARALEPEMVTYIVTLSYPHGVLTLLDIKREKHV